MSVRVLRGPVDDEPLASAAASAPFAASAFRIAAEGLAARAEAARAREQAEEQARAVVAQALSEAEVIRRSARAAALAAAHAEVLALLVRARALEASLVERALPIVEHAVVAVAERLREERVAADPAALAAWVRASVAPLLGARRLQLRANPATVARLSAALAELARRGLGELPIELAIDAAAVDGVVVARSDLGEVRLELGAQLANLVEAIGPTLADALRGARG